MKEKKEFKPELGKLSAQKIKPIAGKVIAVAAACLIAMMLISNCGRSGKVIDATAEFVEILSSSLVGHSIGEEDLVRETVEERALGRKAYVHVFRHYKTAKSISLHNFGEMLEKNLEGTRFRIVNHDYYYDNTVETAKFDIKCDTFDIFALRIDREEPSRREEAKKTFSRPRIAIVLDDFGYNYKNVEAIFDMKTPITFSVLPNLRYSSRISEEAASRGHEVILHLPLEPLEEDLGLERDTITTDISRERIFEILGGIMTSMPNLKGISNHMGSKAMQDEEVVTAIVAFLEDRDMYFLDSLVTNSPLAEEIAARRGVPFVERSVFLDNKADPAYIRKQIHELRDLALAKGSALGIGHDRRGTVEVLREVIPALVAEGIEFVFASDLKR
ncbi:MAG: divergent polysaccharide deacetylase family protein [Candidatus Omnitrophota bacterium]